MSPTQARHLQGGSGASAASGAVPASASPSVQGVVACLSGPSAHSQDSQGLAAVFSSKSELLFPRKLTPGHFQPNPLFTLSFAETLPGSSASLILILILWMAHTRPGGSQTPVWSHKTTPATGGPRPHVKVCPRGGELLLGAKTSRGQWPTGTQAAKAGHLAAHCPPAPTLSSGGRGSLDKAHLWVLAEERHWVQMRRELPGGNNLNPQPDAGESPSLPAGAQAPVRALLIAGVNTAERTQSRSQ